MTQPTVFPVTTTAGGGTSCAETAPDDGIIRSFEVEGGADETDTDSVTVPAEDDDDEEELRHRYRIDIGIGFDEDDEGRVARSCLCRCTASEVAVHLMFLVGVVIAYVSVSTMLVTDRGLLWLIMVVPMTCVVMTLIVSYARRLLLPTTGQQRTAAGQRCTTTFVWTLIFAAVELPVLLRSPIPVAALLGLWVILVVFAHTCNADPSGSGRRHHDTPRQPRNHFGLLMNLGIGNFMS